MRDYQAVIKSPGYTKCSYGSVEGFIAANVLVGGLKRAPANPTRIQLMKSLETLNLDMGGFKVAFSPNSRQGSPFTEMTVINADGRITR